MSAENLIKRIRDDAQQQIKQIKKDADQQVQSRLDQAKLKAKQDAEHLIEQAKKDVENTKRILVSQAEQQAKRATMNTREELIEHSFEQAQQKLQQLKGKQYESFLKTLIEQAKKQLGTTMQVWVTREQDKKLVKDLGGTVKGIIEGSGGLLLQSKDGYITLDNTFEGILRRKKQEIRIHVGKLLFSQQGDH